LDRESVIQVKIAVKITPSAGRNEILSLTNDIWRIKIAAPPEKGKANKELIEFLSERLGIKKDSVIIIKGQTSHNKIVAISGVSHEMILRRLTPNK
jgi:uncharacterized protein